MSFDIQKNHEGWVSDSVTRHFVAHLVRLLLAIKPMTPR